MSPNDYELVGKVREYIRNYYSADRHHVACGILTNTGKIIYGLHLESDEHDICAESVAISRIVTGTSDREAVSIVAVYCSASGKTAVISPCGDCRQLILEYIPSVSIIIDDNGVLTKKPISELLPYPYIKPKLD